MILKKIILNLCIFFMQMFLITLINAAEMPEGLIYDKDKIEDLVKAYSGKAVLFLGAIPTEAYSLQHDDDVAVICLNDEHRNVWKSGYTSEDHKAQMGADWTTNFIQADFNNIEHLSRLAKDFSNTFELITMDISVRKFASAWSGSSLAYFINMLKLRGKLVFDNGGYGLHIRLSPSVYDTMNELLMPKIDLHPFFSCLQEQHRYNLRYGYACGACFQLEVKDYTQEEEITLSDKCKECTHPSVSSLINKIRGLKVKMDLDYKEYINSFFEASMLTHYIDYSIEYGFFPYWKNRTVNVNYLILTKTSPEVISPGHLVKMFKAKNGNSSER